jgi:hypothetical protein
MAKMIFRFSVLAIFGDLFLLSYAAPKELQKRDGGVCANLKTYSG